MPHKSKNTQDLYSVQAVAGRHVILYVSWLFPLWHSKTSERKSSVAQLHRPSLSTEQTSGEKATATSLWSIVWGGGDVDSCLSEGRWFFSAHWRTDVTWGHNKQAQLKHVEGRQVIKNQRNSYVLFMWSIIGLCAWQHNLLKDLWAIF